jgi:hypothetical protein
MRLVITTTALALVALWAAVMPLVTQQGSTRTPRAMSTALFLCNMQQGIDQHRAAALANALIIEQSKPDPTATAGQTCHAGPRTFPERPGTRP